MTKLKDYEKENERALTHVWNTVVWNVQEDMEKEVIKDCFADRAHSTILKTRAREQYGDDVLWPDMRTKVNIQLELHHPAEPRVRNRQGHSFLVRDRSRSRPFAQHSQLIIILKIIEN